ncbi:MAG: homoserine kinase [Aquificae bacterium]|nr:homoserine kinase [Aquificota bacterium]
MKLRVPATTTNFGSGFDAFGLALNLYNFFEVFEKDAFSVEIEGEGKNLPKDENNLVIKVYKTACERYGKSVKPFFLKQTNHVPTARGLGSSATAIVGGILIFEKLHNLNLSLEDKLRLAFEFENHPDNLLPAFVGGFVLCVGGDKLLFKKLPFPEDITLVFVVPDFELSTEKARSVIKKEVPLSDAVFNIQRSSLLVASFLTKDYDLIKFAVEDRLHQPYRSELIRGFDEVLKAGYDAGAYGVFLSGAGPTVCALSPPDEADTVGKAMKEAFEKVGVSSKVLSLKAQEEGAKWLNTPSQGS